MEIVGKVFSRSKRFILRKPNRKAKEVASQDRDGSQQGNNKVDLSSNSPQNIHWIKFTEPELHLLLCMVNYSRAHIKSKAAANPRLMKNVPVALKEIDKMEDKVLDSNALDRVDNIFGFELS